MANLRIKQGEDKTYTTQIVVEGLDGVDRAFDLSSGVTEIKAQHLHKDSSQPCVEKTLTGGGVVIVGTGVNGEISVTLPIADSANLKSGKNLDIEYEITKDGKLTIVTALAMLDVEEQLC